MTNAIVVVLRFVKHAFFFFLLQNRGALSVSSCINSSMDPTGRIRLIGAKQYKEYEPKLQS